MMTDKELYDILKMYRNEELTLEHLMQEYFNYTLATQ